VTRRVRFRLLAAFTVLLLAAVVLAGVGWWGMRSTQRALAGVEHELLPTLSHALELSQRTTQLALVAPKLSESATEVELEAHRGTALQLLQQIQQRSVDLQPSAGLQRVIGPLHQELGRQLDTLVALTRAKQQLQQRLAAQRRELETLGAAWHGAGAAARALPRPAPTPPVHVAAAPPDEAAQATALWSTLVLGLGAEDAATIGRLQADVEALMLAARARGTLARLPQPQGDALRQLADGGEGLLAQRQRLLDLERRGAYLVVLARANADELNSEVSLEVARLRGVAAERSNALERAVRSGETGVLVLALVAIGIAALAARYVRRLVGEIEAVTAHMVRLAEGDTTQQPAAALPPGDRPDELGALAHSFELLRDQALARQRLVAELHTQREQLEAVLESLTDGLAVFDRERRLLLWNRRFAELLAPMGAVPRVGVPLAELFAGLPPGARWQGAPGRAGHDAALRGDGSAGALTVAGNAANTCNAVTGHGDDAARAIAGSPGVSPADAAAWDGSGQVELQLPDGGVWDLRSRRMPAGGSVTLATDLTARRAIERELQQAQKLEVLGQLTGGVAHDFNNHLGTMLGNLVLLQSELAGAPRAEALWQRVQRAAASAAGLTRRLLAFARRQPLQAEQVELDGMLEEMRDLIEYSAGEAVEVTLALGAPGALLHLDRGQLENAVLNLVMNSAAAMPDGGRLQVGTGVDPDGRVRLSVADSGIGLPPALRDKVFEPFFTTKADGKGSGLGLSIVYGFVKQSGGDITLQSEPGAGTTVLMRLPPAQAPEARAAAAGAGDAPAGAAAASDDAALHGLRVLVVEDDEAFRATLLDLLQRAGAAAQGVRSAELALQALQAAPALPQLVLSDICLGRGQDGLGLARTLRQRWPALPVILMSGLAPEMLGQPTDWLREFGFLQKPFAMRTLADVSRVGPRHEHSTSEVHLRRV
jgi:signal transduction histidine kinase/PAS domain-containing protein